MCAAQPLLPTHCSTAIDWHHSRKIMFDGYHVGTTEVIKVDVNLLWNFYRDLHCNLQRLAPRTTHPTPPDSILLDVLSAYGAGLPTLSSEFFMIWCYDTLVIFFKDGHHLDCLTRSAAHGQKRRKGSSSLRWKLKVLRYG